MIPKILNKAMGTNYQMKYDEWYHRLTILEPIRVVDFVLLKRLTHFLREEIYEIRVEG